MRTTVDLPDALFRRTKAVAALRGMTLKEVIARAIEKEVNSPAAPAPKAVRLPLVRMKAGRKPNLEGLDFDDLLA